MALSYDVVLASQVEPAEAVGIVRDLVGGRPADDGRLVVMTGLVVGAGVVDYEPEGEAERGRWGFDPAVSVGFALKPEPADWERAEDTMSIAAVGVAARLDCDAGFSFQGERKLFVRRDGLITLYFGWRPWNEPAVLAHVPAPHTVEPAPEG